MLKRVLIVGASLALVASVGLYFWAQSILATSTVRTTLAAQLSSAIGQPVTIQTIRASIYPRITVNLGGVGIGSPERIRIRTLQVGTDLRALMSRQIAHASLRLSGGRIELPLPPFGSPTSAPPNTQDSSPVEIVSVDEIVLKDVQVVSGGHTLRADIDAVPAAKGLTLQRISLAADNASIKGVGKITDVVGPVGELSLNADALDFTRLLSFASDFSSQLGVSDTRRATASQGRHAARSTGMNVVVSLQAGRATLGTMMLDRLIGTARISDSNMRLDPIEFGLFRGRYQGTMVVALADSPDFRIKASLAGVDVADAMTFAGTPGVISGKLAGRIDLAGRGTDASATVRSARGTVRVDIRDGIVRNLGLLRAVVIATSMRADSRSPAGGESNDEPFSLLGATLKVADGVATTDDLLFESADLSLNAAGSVRLDGSVVDLKGKVQLSDALSGQAGRDLIRYTQENGRVTLPATVTGSASHLSVGIDLGSAMERAIKNRVGEEVEKALKKGLGDLFKK